MIDNLIARFCNAWENKPGGDISQVGPERELDAETPTNLSSGKSCLKSGVLTCIAPLDHSGQLRSNLRKNTNNEHSS